MHAALGGLGEVRGDSWQQLAELGLAFVLSSLIGLERAMRGRDAGLRTYALVGVGAALFLLVGKYGFENALTTSLVVLDPSRVAAQVVTGVGFLGSALVIKRGETVRGLTTAATVWVTAAIGMACAAGLLVLAVAVTAAHFIVVFGYTRLRGTLGLAPGPSEITVAYRDGEGVLRSVLATCSQLSFTVGEVATEYRPADPRAGGGRVVSIVLRVHGRGSIPRLTGELQSLDGVLQVHGGDSTDEMVA
ncbi:MAG: MgtC/SapB family protein [Streptosporangiaceae bacterium]